MELFTLNYSCYYYFSTAVSFSEFLICFGVFCNKHSKLKPQNVNTPGRCLTHVSLFPIPVFHSHWLGGIVKYSAVSL